MTSVLLFTSCQDKINEEDKPFVKKGVLDLRNRDLNKTGNLQLSGEWEFYWKKLYSPQDFQEKNIQAKHYFTIPGYWNDKMLDTTKLSGHAYASYRLKVISDTAQTLGIFIDEQMTAYKFWCNDSLIFACGKVSDKKENAQARRYPILKEIDLVKGTNELVFQISNYHHIKGGFFTIPQIGEVKKIRRERSRSIGIDIFMLGSLLIISFYHIVMSIYRKGMYAVLLFGLFSFVLALRILLTGARFFSVIFPEVSWAEQIRLEYFSAFFASPLIIAYIYLIYKKDFNKTIVLINLVLSLIFCLTLFFPPVFFTSILPFFHIHLLFILSFYFYRIIILVKRKREGAAILLVSFLIFALTVVADILLVRNGYTYQKDLVPFGTFILMLGQSLVFARVIVKYFEDNQGIRIKLDKKNKELESIVKQQSIELKKQHKDILQQIDEIENQNEKIRDTNIELIEQTGLLAKSEAKVRSIVELLPESIFEIDWNGNILIANYEFYKHTEYTKEDDLNVQKLFNYNASCNLFFNCMMEKMQGKKIIKELKIDIKRKNGSIFPSLLSASLIENDPAVAYRCTFIDITPRIEDQEVIRNAYELIKDKNKKISDSLRYASTIQKAFMPSPQLLSNSFTESFVINKPHSIVSGDFYFLKRKGNKIVFALSDCTGHGVPAGFMTMLGITLLNQLYTDDEIVSPEVALGLVRESIITSLHQSNNEDIIGNQDGMDMVLSILDTETLNMQFASAKQSILLSRDCKITKLSGDRMPVGIYAVMDEFTLRSVQLKKGDVLYYYSDGIIDIFGGPRGKRLLSKGLQRIIYSCCDKNLEEQGKIVNNELIKWQGDNQQIDDMLLVGIQI